MFEPRFTICFCVSGNDVLFLRRNKPPYDGMWNGLGGKIEPGETPRSSVEREVLEEAGISLREADVRYRGIVSWIMKGQPEPAGGMFAFVAFFGRKPWAGDRSSPEGALSWRPVSWALDLSNTEMADIVPHYLHSLVTLSTPMEYRFRDSDGVLSVRPLPKKFACQ